MGIVELKRVFARALAEGILSSKLKEGKSATQGKWTIRDLNL